MPEPETAPAPGPCARHNPALAAFAGFAAGWVFILVTLGALTTTIGAGMVFPDWPLSNGSLNPKGWLDDLSMFAEHSHRLSAGVETSLTVVLAVWLWRCERRRWLRNLGVFAVLLILTQAVLGGLRVLLDHVRVESLETSVGRLIAMLHACIAQAVAAILIAIAAACSRGWITGPVPVAPRVRRAGVAVCALLFLQLAVAAVMRHSFAGLAIPSFPWSSPDGGLLPQAWNFRVAIHFTHRVLALLIAVGVCAFASLVWRDRGSTLGMRAGASALVALLCLQVLLGAEIILTQRRVGVTTGHVLVGSLTLATAVWIAWSAHRDRLESAPAP